VADVEDAVVGVDAADAAEAGDRAGALRHELVFSGAGDKSHHHVDVLGADGEVHGAADGGDVVGLAGASWRGRR
jgi:hypothetical protein